MILINIIQSDLLGNKKPNKTTKKLLLLLAFDELVLNYIILDILIYNKRLNSICISQKGMVPSDVYLTVWICESSVISGNGWIL
jgi:hypothetical protein